jgi:sortase A
MSETASNPGQPDLSVTDRSTAIAPALTPTSKPAARGRVMRTAGNLLIGVGVLLLLGVGGFLGIQTYLNNQEAQQIDSQNSGLPLAAPILPQDTPLAQATAAGTSLPGVNPPVPTPTAPSDTVLVANAPLPNLNTGAPGASQVGQQQTSPPTRIVIKSVGIDSPVVDVGWTMIPGKDGQQSSQWEVADYAVGHNQGSANPGEVGNVVMSGHVDWKGEVFRNLHKVNRGDEVSVYSADREFVYIVQGIVRVKEEGSDVTDAMRRANASYMNPTPDQTLTLITCWPYGVDDYRLIVIAKPYDSGLPARPDLMLK